jgi:hypothetical protein
MLKKLTSVFSALGLSISSIQFSFAQQDFTGGGDVNLSLVKDSHFISIILLVDNFNFYFITIF